VLVHACNPSNSEAEIGVQAWYGQKVAKPYLKNKVGMVYKPVIPATWEAAVRGLQSKASLGKNVKPYQKDKLKATRLELWLK
jgi:hypothetical protein